MREEGVIVGESRGRGRHALEEGASVATWVNSDSPRAYFTRVRTPLFYALWRTQVKEAGLEK